MSKILTIGIPTYRALSTIDRCLMSIAIQTAVDKVEIILGVDDPEESKAHTYQKLIDKYKDFFSITILDCDKNGGPGLARQRCLAACKTPWITFMDADDILSSPLSIENLLKGVASPEIIEVQGAFLQEGKRPDGTTMFSARNDATHPWVFGRLYNVGFLKTNGIEFSELRAMEDGEFNWKIRMSIDGTPLKINIINDPVYIWKEGSEHSITRTGIDENGIPQYNFDLCPIGATIASIRAAKFCKSKNPFNGGVTRFIVEQMVGQYFTYIECCKRKPIFKEQCFFNAKRFYNECYKDIEKDISDEILNTMYTAQYAGRAKDLIGIIPEITFFDFINKIKEEEYKGEEELISIRQKYPKEIIENDKKTGVSIF